MKRLPLPIAAGVVVLALLGTMGAAGPVHPADRRRPGGAADPAGLSDTAPCPDADRFTCGYLSVPLDRSGRVPGTLRLRAAVAGNRDAHRGVLMFLTGGPGQPGVSLLPRITARIAYLLQDYQLVMVDQRGTGEAAVDCPALQLEVGSSDVTPASSSALDECADVLGKTRNFYTTADTVADLDALRQTLGVRAWTMDGVSYGTFVAEHYGLTYPQHVTRMVLDSVVPQDGPRTLYADGLARSAYVLRQACQEQSCGFDPAADLAQVVRSTELGVGLYDLIVIGSIVDPKLAGPPAYFPVLSLIHQAALGDVEPLAQAVAAIQGGADTPIQQYSAGLHIATVCADLTDAPWGDSATPVGQRAGELAAAVAGLSEQSVWPFTRQTAGGQGLAHNCAAWAVSRPNPSPRLPRLTMPVLLIAGDRDLSTPLPWAREQAARTPRGRLVVIAGMGHSIQGRDAAGDAAVRAFLLTDCPA
ncbi:pimeloyl-ACP methyl ester carboxylesterase [Hamadaea flava]|uniref:Alpha/beta fold hydrolase n=1 Tax=Hamadaea flava TaxID=1742688 RepID=A0ABV8LY19_9ACTN|nr:alpha/beta fold hydrolase [Hamadaea flava]MCP2328922.1 pimeloyl-ACP methyl ester carboxylesterase [Hamadaea flava]